MMTAEEFAVLDARREELIHAAAREFSRYEEHRRKWRGRLAGKGRRSRAKFNSEKLGDMFGVYGGPGGPLDGLAGMLILGTLERPSDYLAYTRAIVGAFLQQFAHLRCGVVNAGQHEQTAPALRYELTPAGEQAVIPGCERNLAPAKRQLDLFG